VFAVSGSPVQALVDALKTALQSDAALMAIVTAVTGHVSEDQRGRLAMPYLVLGRRTRTGDVGTFGSAGSQVSVQIDWWSEHRGPSEAQTIGSHLSRILERRTLRLSGFVMVSGSLTCEFEEVFDEPDTEMPSSKLYHGTQRWTTEIHETS
jgi:hypothetical protein